jgi:hypothetical protein
MDVFGALKTEGTTAIFNIATETKQADALLLPSWISTIFGGGFYSATNDKAVSAVGRRWRIVKA